MIFPETKLMSANVTAERQLILRNVAGEVKTLWINMKEEEDTFSDRARRLDPLQVCYMQLRIFKAMQERNEVPIDHTNYLRECWDDIADGLWIVAGRRYDGHSELARTCLALIEELEPCPVDPSDDEAFSAWAHSFHPPDSAFAESLIYALVRFLPDDGASLCARARRISILDHRPRSRRRRSSTAPSISIRSASRYRPVSLISKLDDEKPAEDEISQQGSILASGEES